MWVLGEQNEFNNELTRSSSTTLIMAIDFLTLWNLSGDGIITSCLLASACTVNNMFLSFNKTYLNRK